MVNLELLAIPVLLPLAAAILIFILPRRVPWVREVLTLLAASGAFAAALRIFLIRPEPLRMPLIALAASPLASFILLFATGYGVLLSLYSFSYFAANPRGKEYYAVLLSLYSFSYMAASPEARSTTRFFRSP